MDKNKKAGASEESQYSKEKNARQGNDQLDSKKDGSTPLTTKKEKVTRDDLKGKKVDAFPDVPEDRPLNKNK